MPLGGVALALESRLEVAPALLGGGLAAYIAVSALWLWSAKVWSLQSDFKQ